MFGAHKRRVTNLLNETTLPVFEYKSWSYQKVNSATNNNQIYVNITVYERPFFFILDAASNYDFISNCHIIIDYVECYLIFYVRNNDLFTSIELSLVRKIYLR